MAEKADFGAPNQILRLTIQQRTNIYAPHDQRTKTALSNIPLNQSKLTRRRSYFYIVKKRQETMPSSITIIQNKALQIPHQRSNRMIRIDKFFKVVGHDMTMSINQFKALYAIFVDIEGNSISGYHQEAVVIMSVPGRASTPRFNQFWLYTKTD